MKNLFLMGTVVALLSISNPVSSAEIDALSGRYVYDSYKATFRNGRSLSLRQLGATSATLEILQSMALKMEMRMINGTSNITEGRIIELKRSGSRGYFVAQWPDMTYPVKEEFTLIPNGLRYTIHFTNPSDAMRYGGKEEATLRKIDER